MRPLPVAVLQEPARGAGPAGPPNPAGSLGSFCRSSIVDRSCASPTSLPHEDLDALTQQAADQRGLVPPVNAPISLRQGLRIQDRSARRAAAEAHRARVEHRQRNSCRALP